jgi:N-acetylmuramoyl-L-alanine amidase
VPFVSKAHGNAVAADVLRFCVHYQHDSKCTNPEAIGFWRRTRVDTCQATIRRPVLRLRLDDGRPHAKVRTDTEGHVIPGTARSYIDNVTMAQRYGRNFDAIASSPYYMYSEDSEAHVAWYEDEISLSLKYQLVNTRELGGIGIWHLGLGRDNEHLWNAIQNAFSGELLLPFASPRMLPTTGNDLLSLAAQHIGEKYQAEVVVPKDNQSWHGPWNCGEFLSWCVFQKTGRPYGCADSNETSLMSTASPGYWQRDAQSLGTQVTVEQAATIPGAVMLRFTVGDKIGHLAFCDGNGGTIEAHSSSDGVIRGMLTGRRWDMGILVPWVEYGQHDRPVLLPPTSTIYHLTSPLMQGEAVYAIQRRLTELGYGPGPLDGVYGPHTAAAIHAFQVDMGLTPDGEVGSKTAAALQVNI